MKRATDFKEPLLDMWYLALSGAELAKGKTKGITIINKRVVLGRNKDGSVFCLRDLCPHRGVPLSSGGFDGKELQCCYHGWKFDSTGQCTSIPSLGEQDDRTKSVKVFAFPCEERNGNIWVFVPRHEVSSSVENVIDIPNMSLDPGKSFRHVSTHHLVCDMDNATIGLIDPAHVPSVHGVWWWRSKSVTKEKVKEYVPYLRGFLMQRHSRKLPKILKMLLGEMSTEISFQLPGIRLEHIRFGKREIVLVLALYPVSENLTILHQLYYTDLPLLKLIAPFFRFRARKFIDQDVEVIKKQSIGLADKPQLMLVGDADQLAKWYYKLKQSHIQSTEERIEFKNPIKKTKLTWWT